MRSTKADLGDRSEHQIVDKDLFYTAPLAFKRATGGHGLSPTYTSTVEANGLTGTMRVDIRPRVNVWLYVKYQYMVYCHTAAWQRADSYQQLLDGVNTVGAFDAQGLGASTRFITAGHSSVSWRSQTVAMNWKLEAGNSYQIRLLSLPATGTWQYHKDGLYLTYQTRVEDTW